MITIPSIQTTILGTPEGRAASAATKFAKLAQGRSAEDIAFEADALRDIDAPVPPKAPRAPRKPRLTVDQIPAGTAYEFERETCGRCSGTGRYPSAAWNGVCLGCQGQGKSLTAAGRAAKKAHDAWVTERLTISVRSIEVGMKIRPSQIDGWKTITAIGEEHTNGRSKIGDGDWTDVRMITVTTAKSGTYGLLADGTVTRAATQDEKRELIASIAHLKGVTLKYPETA